MPAVFAALLGGLIQIAGTVAGRVLLGLGIAVITYTGLSTGMDWAKAQALQAFSQLDSQWVAIMGYMKVGSCISIVTSAMTARALLNGVTGDSVKRWVLK